MRLILAVAVIAVIGCARVNAQNLPKEWMTDADEIWQCNEDNGTNAYTSEEAVEAHKCETGYHLVGYKLIYPLKSPGVIPVPPEPAYEATAIYRECAALRIKILELASDIRSQEKRIAALERRGNSKNQPKGDRKP